MLGAVGVDPDPLVPQPGRHIEHPGFVGVRERQDVERMPGDLVAEPDGIIDACIRT
jgi:hypothetical protein